MASYLLLFLSFCFFINQQYGRPDLAARHHLSEFQERRFALDNDAQSAASHLEQRENTLHTEVKGSQNTHGTMTRVTLKVTEAADERVVEVL